MTAPASRAPHLCVVRLSGASKLEIQVVDALDSASPPTRVSITCKQVPSESDVGDVVLLWIGSDNNKGIATSWKQGFRALGTIAGLNRTGGRNDPTHIDLDIAVVFDESLNKEDIINAVGASYGRLVDFPVLGVNNYSSQVVQIVDTTSSKQDASLFFGSIGALLSKSKANIGNKISALLSAVGITPAAGQGPRASKADPKDSYSRERFCNETGIPDAALLDLIARVKRKKQLILIGPPGSGKTWIAQRLAMVLADESGGIHDIIQFHPNYAYEDFIGGIKPETTGEGHLTYTVAGGRFVDFCELARQVPDAAAVLVIDEINRADIARVFGEAMILLDYRDMSITLSGDVNGGKFSIPDNVVILGTMNSADRSVALFDHAMRRRFSFAEIKPNYELLRTRAAAAGLDVDALLRAIEALNAAIADPDYFVGISFFIADVAVLKDELPSIWSGEIVPYVKELFTGRPELIARFTWEAVKAMFFGSWYDVPPTNPNT